MSKGFNQGRAYALAKDFYRNAAFSQMTYRWSVYEWTLQGDPTMLDVADNTAGTDRNLSGYNTGKSSGADSGGELFRL
jgi:hypothetical protein